MNSSFIKNYIMLIMAIFSLQTLGMQNLIKNNINKNTLIKNKRVFSTGSQPYSHYHKASWRTEGIMSKNGKAEEQQKHVDHLRMLFKQELVGLYKNNKNQPTLQLFESASKEAIKEYEKNYIPFLAKKYWREYQEDINKEEYTKALYDEFDYIQKIALHDSFKNNIHKESDPLLAKQTGYFNLTLDNKVNVATERVQFESIENTINELVEKEFKKLHRAQPQASANQLIEKVVENAKNFYNKEYLSIEAQTYSRYYKEDLPLNYYIRKIKKDSQMCFDLLGQKIRRGILQATLSEKLNVPFGSLNQIQAKYPKLYNREKEKEYMASSRLQLSNNDQYATLNRLIEEEFRKLAIEQPHAFADDIMHPAIESAHTIYKKNYLISEATKYHKKYGNDLAVNYYESILENQLEHIINYHKRLAKSGTLQKDLSKKVLGPLYRDRPVINT